MVHVISGVYGPCQVCLSVCPCQVCPYVRARNVCLSVLLHLIVSVKFHALCVCLLLTPRDYIKSEQASIKLFSNLGHL